MTLYNRITTVPSGMFTKEELDETPVHVLDVVQQLDNEACFQVVKIFEEDGVEKVLLGYGSKDLKSVVVLREQLIHC